MSDTPAIDAAVEWVPGYHVFKTGLVFDGRRHEMIPAEHFRPLERALREIAIDRDVDVVGAYADGWYAALDVCRNIASAAIAKAEGK